MSVEVGAFVTVPEAARLTGFSRWTILRAVRDGRIRARQMGRAVRIAKPDLDAAVREWERAAAGVSVSIRIQNVPTVSMLDAVFSRSGRARKGIR